MKKLLFALFATIASFTCMSFAQADEAEWTTKEGKSFKAEFISATDDKLTVKSKGKRYVIKMKSLSLESQGQALELKKQKSLPLVGLFLIAGAIFVVFKIVPSASKTKKINWVPPWEKEVPVEWNLDLLRQLEWKRFEELTVAYARSKGLHCVATRHGADGGVDMYVGKSRDEEPFAAIQCKAWRTRKVGVKPVRELLGVVAAKGMSKGIFMTSGSYTREAVEFAEGQPLELIDGNDFIGKIKQLSKSDQEKLFFLAREGDFTTPTCPNCNVKMVSRESKKGTNAGSRFWGCPTYPKCRQTFKID